MTSTDTQSQGHPNPTTGLSVQVALLSFGQVCTIGLSLGMAAILSRILTPHLYGTFRQILLIYTTVAVVFQSGLPRAVSYFLPRCTRQQGKTALLHILVMLTATGSAFSICLYLGADTIAMWLNSQDLAPLLRAYSPMPAILFPTLALEGVCMTYGTPGRFVIFEITSKILTLLAVIVPITQGYTLVISLYTWLAAAFISLLAAMILMAQPFRKDTQSSCPFTLRDILIYSLPIMCSSLLATALTGADRLTVSHYFAPHVFALFVNGAIEFPLLSIIIASSKSVLMPAFSRLGDNPNDRAEILQIWHRSIHKSALILYPAAAFAFFFASDAIILLYSARYQPSTIYFRIYLAMVVTRVAAIEPVLLGLGDSTWFATGHVIAAAVTWIGCLTLCPLLGDPAWAAVSFVAGIYAMAGFCTIIIASKFRVRLRSVLPLRDMARIGIVSVFAGAVAYMATVFLVRDTPIQTLVHLGVGATVFTAMFIPLAQITGCQPFQIIQPFFQFLSLPLKSTTDQAPPTDKV